VRCVEVTNDTWFRKIMAAAIRRSEVAAAIRNRCSRNRVGDEERIAAK
jgi:hypothetical protein